MSDNKIKIQEFVDSTNIIIDQLEKLDIDQFQDRILNFKTNLDSLSNHTIRSGLVGITSSGKSALLNVLLGTGEKILKEQSKATTNMIVFCAKSQEPKLEIYFEGKEPVFKSGKGVLSESIWKYTSEDENPGNKYNVQYIRLKIPTFTLDDSLEIADTPGLDAYGLKEHEDLTLREFLPQADLIIYLSSIRSPMKEADRRIINKIMDAEQQIVFVQTCKGAVVEQNYGDGATASLEKQYDEYKNNFKEEISPYPKLKDAPIAQVETKTALKYFKTKDESYWEESGFAEFSQIIADITSQLKEKFTLRELRKRRDEFITLNRLIKNSVKKDSAKESDLNELTNTLKKQKYYFDKITQDKNDTISTWNKKLHFLDIYKEIKKELLNAETEEDFYVIADTVGDRAKKIKNTFLDSLDDSKRTYKHDFVKIGLDVKRTDLHEITKSEFFFPNVQKNTRTKAEANNSDKEKKQEQQSAKSTTKKELYLDKEKYYTEIKQTLELYFEPLLKHLIWWNTSIEFSYIIPLEKKITAFEKDIANIKKEVVFDKNQYEELTDITEKIDNITTDIYPLCENDPFKQKIVYAKYKKKPLSTYKRKIEDKNLFIQLGKLLFENMFHTNYLKKLSDITDIKTTNQSNSQASNQEKCIALISQDYKSQIEFLRRLMRFDDESFTLLTKSSPPFSLNMLENISGIENINIRGELYDEVSFVLLSNDKKSFEIVKNTDLFNKVDVIQLLIDDLHRVSSAVTDIKERNVFFEIINDFKNKLLLTYSKAAYFQKDRLHLLVEEVITEIDQLFYPEKTHWFIYENFEIRYNNYYEIASMIKNKKLKPIEGLNQWKEQGIALDEPFSEKILRDQFNAVTY